MGKTGKIIVAIVVAIIIVAIVYFVFFKKQSISSVERNAVQSAASSLTNEQQQVIAIQNEELKNSFGTTQEYSQFIFNRVKPNLGKILINGTRNVDLLEYINRPMPYGLGTALTKVAALKAIEMFLVSEDDKGNYFLSKIVFDPGNPLTERQLKIHYNWLKDSNVSPALKSAITDNDLFVKLPKKGNVNIEEAFDRVTVKFDY